MPAIIEKPIEQIINNANLLTVQQQNEIVNEINRMLRLNRCRELNNSIISSNFTEDEIVAECRRARKEREVGFLKGQAKVIFNADWEMTPEELGMV